MLLIYARYGRRERREENAIKAQEADNSQEAHKYLQRAVGVTGDMIYSLIRELRKNNVEFLVAPYEADPQLAYLSMSGFVDAVITEDSDVLVMN